MNPLIVLLMLCLAVPAMAETWKDKEIREAQERQILLQQSNPQYQRDQNRSTAKASALGACMGACGSDHGICVSNCGNSGSCFARCAEAQSRCTSRCN